MRDPLAKPKPQRLTIQQAADRMGVCHQTVRRWIRKGLLRSFTTPAVSKYGVRHRILEADLAKFQARHFVGPDRIEAPRIVGGEGSGNGADPGAKQENSQRPRTPENLY